MHSACDSMDSNDALRSVLVASTDLNRAATSNVGGAVAREERRFGDEHRLKEMVMGQRTLSQGSHSTFDDLVKSIPGYVPDVIPPGSVMEASLKILHRHDSWCRRTRRRCTLNVSIFSTDISSIYSLGLFVYL